MSFSVVAAKHSIILCNQDSIFPRVAEHEAVWAPHAPPLPGIERLQF